MTALFDMIQFLFCYPSTEDLAHAMPIPLQLIHVGKFDNFKQFAIPVPHHFTVVLTGLSNCAQPE